MLNFKHYGQNYINWVLRLGRMRATILGLFVVSVFAITIQILLSFLFTGQAHPQDLFRSIAFGMFSAPFVMYFFTLIVEKLERSRRRLEQSVKELSLLREHDARLNVELEQQADFLRSFFDASPDLIFYRDGQGKYLSCNRAMEILTGLSKDEIVNMLPHDIFPEDTAKLMLDTDRDTLLSNSVITYEQWIRHPNNKLACYEIRKVPYYDRVLKRDCIMGFGRDITERKRYQETIEKNSRDKTTLMATISHELRTPLNGIIGLSRILLEGELLPEQREYLQTINISAISLGHIFSDIIDLEKLDSRRIELFRKEVEFSQLINDISLFANLMADQKKIHFHIHYDDDLPDFIYVDNARLSQIIWNLLSNAVKFTPAGGDIFLHIRRVDEDHFSFELKDTGIGIPKNEQRKIFAMFYQTDAGRKGQGSGIGLAISRRIAKLMGGSLRVESDVGQGSTFILTIQAREAEKSNNIKINAHPLKVLLVEDIEVNVVVARAMLEKFGCEVDVAMSGDEAFRRFEQSEYDLILLDIQLPDTTGFDIAQKWREQYDEGDIDYLPLLVALTANVIQTKKQYLEQGMDDVLRKPLSLEALAECLNAHFDDDFRQPETEAPPASPSAIKSSELTADKRVFDRQMLQELYDVMGGEALLKNFQLLAELMPGYITQLQFTLREWQRCDSEEQRLAVCNEAHKIKGALASVGLCRVQQIAQLAQNDSEQWAKNIEQWVEQIAAQWLDDWQQANAWVKTLGT